MTLTNIIKMINRRLAGELLSYNELEVHLDSVIDEINARLSSKFPAFSEFNNVDHEDYPDYNFFPDKYIRTVVVVGATLKFYSADAEGMHASPDLLTEYQQNMFFMVRDYSNLVPEDYQDLEQGYLVLPEDVFDDIILNNLDI